MPDGVGSPTMAGWVSSRAKSVNYVRAFWNAVPEGGVAGKLSRGPSLWRAGWQGGQEAPRSGGRGGKVAKGPSFWRAGWRAAQGPPERPRAADDPLPPNGDSKWSRCAYFSRNSTPSANSNWLAEGVAR